MLKDRQKSKLPTQKKLAILDVPDPSKGSQTAIVPFDAPVAKSEPKPKPKPKPEPVAAAAAAKKKKKEAPTTKTKTEPTKEGSLDSDTEAFNGKSMDAGFMGTVLGQWSNGDKWEDIDG